MARRTKGVYPTQYTLSIDAARHIKALLYREAKASGNPLDPNYKMALQALTEMGVKVEEWF